MNRTRQKTRRAGYLIPLARMGDKRMFRTISICLLFLVPAFAHSAPRLLNCNEIQSLSPSEIRPIGIWTNGEAERQASSYYQVGIFQLNSEYHGWYSYWKQGEPTHAFPMWEARIDKELNTVFFRNPNEEFEWGPTEYSLELKSEAANLIGPEPLAFDLRSSSPTTNKTFLSQFKQALSCK